MYLLLLLFLFFLIVNTTLTYHKSCNEKTVTVAYLHIQELQSNMIILSRVSRPPGEFKSNNQSLFFSVFGLHQLPSAVTLVAKSSAALTSSLLTVSVC